jgi:hypothetical protein
MSSDVLLSFEFSELEKNIHNQLLKYEFRFESYYDKYYDAVVHIRIIRTDFPAAWSRSVNIKDSKFEWLPTWPPMSPEAEQYIERIYKLRLFF